MRDHPEHAAPMLAGMWGARGGCVQEYDQFLDEYKDVLNNEDPQVDQYFLWQYILPRIKTATVHDEITPYGGNPFPSKRDINDIPFFIGQQYDKDDNPLYPEHMEVF